MFQRILVPVDGSSTSDLALQEALKLAKEQEARLRIIHVVDEVNINLETEFATDEFYQAMRKSGSSILAKSQEHARLAGVSAESELLERVPFGLRISDMIVEEAKRWRADLIIIGTHGRRGVNHLLLGSVAEKVVRMATTPVLLIRGQ